LSFLLFRQFKTTVSACARRCCRAAVHDAFDQTFLSRQARFTAAERYLRRKL
jgi:hypothetical protein